MAELKFIIKQKSKALGGMAALAKTLDWGSKDHPTNLISKYVKGTMPSIEFGIRWKRVFNENLIDLMVDDPVSVVAEPAEPYQDLKTVQAKLIQCMEDREQLKIFFDSHKGSPKLKEKA